MKNYAAIGHWKGNVNTTCIAVQANSVAEFWEDMKGNGFIPYAIISEKRLGKIREYLADTYHDGLFDMIRKMVPNCNKWMEVEEYLIQCMDILEAKITRV